MEREYIRDRTLEGHESARARGKAIGSATVTDEAMLAVALHLGGQEMGLRDIAARLVLTRGKKKGPASLPGNCAAHAPRPRREGRRGGGRLTAVLAPVTRHRRRRRRARPGSTDSRGRAALVAYPGLTCAAESSVHPPGAPAGSGASRGRARRGEGRYPDG
jgi:hypothetical protein